MICTVKGCGRSRIARGFCERHYRRFLKHGSPLAGKAEWGEPLRFLCQTVLHWDNNECLIWPYSIDGYGYGKIYLDEKLWNIHRLVCIISHPTHPSLVARHAVCGNRQCCNWRHLEWGTQSENLQDAIRHGTKLNGEKHPWAKLSDVDVEKIRSLNGVTSHRKIAAMFGVKRSTIDLILNGKIRRSTA